MQRSRAARFCASIPRSQITRETIGSRPGASTATISPVGIRFLMTVPEGNRSPIFAETNSVPSRGAKAGSRIAGSELRSRDGVTRDQLPPVDQCQRLIGHTDDHVCTERSGERCEPAWTNEYDGENERRYYARKTRPHLESL